METQFSEPMSDWFFWFFLVGMLSTFITWIAFARLSMARIERALKADGADQGFHWDSLGGRIVFYALAIALPEKIAHRIDRLIDVSLVRSYSTKKDWILGTAFLLAGDIWIIVSLIAFAFNLD